MLIKRQTTFDDCVQELGVRFHSSGFVTTDASWKQDPLFASYSRLYYVVGGSGLLYTENEAMPLEAGYAYIAPSGMKYGFRGTDTVTKLYFHITLAVGEGEYDAFSRCQHFIRLPYKTEDILRLKDWYLDTDPYAHLQLKSEVTQTVLRALLTLKKQETDGARYSKPVSDAVGYIQKHLTANLTVKEISEAVFCSKSKLFSLFREEVGQTVARYVGDLLMSEAQTLLLYSDMPIGEISDRLGFCDQFYFSRCFSKRFSLSPKQFRQSTRDD